MDAVLDSLTEFAVGLKHQQIPDGVLQAARERLLDSVGCAVGAVAGDTVAIARALAPPPAAGDPGGRLLCFDEVVATDAAAFANSCMIRLLDFNDTYPGGHPSDMLGGLLGSAARHGATGARLLTAMVVAYEVYIRLQMKAQFRERGWDQGGGIGVAAAAGLCNLLGLTPDQTRHALAITTVGNMPLRNTRAGQLSMWKGCATAYAVRNAAFGVQLAQLGMTGPQAPFTGRHGMMDQASGPFELPDFDTFYLPRAKIKYWPVAYNMQLAAWAGVELRRLVPVENIAAIDVATYWSAWSESGSEPAKWDPRTQGTADHSLPYILARALRHGAVNPDAFEPEAYLDPTIRPLMAKIAVRVDEAIQAQFPATIRMRAIATDLDGATHEVDIVNPIGHEDNPISPQGLAEKFDRLCLPVLGQERTVAARRFWGALAEDADIGAGFDLLSLAPDAPARAVRLPPSPSLFVPESAS